MTTFRDSSDVEVWIERGHAVGRAAGVVASLATGAHRPTSQLDSAGIRAADVAEPIETLEAIWMALHSLSDVEHGAAARLRIAAATLDCDPSKPTANEDAIAALAKAIGRHVPMLMEQIKASWPGVALACVGDALWLDETLATYLERLGGADTATAVREKSKARMGGLFPEAPSRVFLLWRDPEALGECYAITRCLGRVLWHAEVKPALARIHNTLARGVATQLLLAPRRSDPSRTRAIEVNEDGTPTGYALSSANGVRLATFAAVASTDARLLRTAIEIDGSPARVLWERTICELVLRSASQARANVNPFNRLRYRHGFAGLARALGIESSAKEVAKLPALLTAAEAWRSHEDIGAVVAEWHVEHEAPGRPAVLQIDVGNALLPGYARRQGIADEEKWLLPVLPIPELPNGVRARDFAGLLDLRWQLLEAFRANLRDLDQGWVVEEALRRSELHVARHVADRAIEAWQTGPKAWLRPTTSGRVTLVSQDALAVLADAREHATLRAAQAAKKASKGVFRRGK